MLSNAMYKDLAGGNTVGHKLYESLNAHWVEWLKIVTQAYWIRDWIRSPILLRPDLAHIEWQYTPSGSQLRCTELQPKLDHIKCKEVRSFAGTHQINLGHADDCGWVENVPAGHAAVALVLLTEAIWNLGFKGWEQWDMRNFDSIAELRGRSLTAAGRVSGSRFERMFDREIFYGQNRTVPWEFVALDRWLYPMWLQAH